MNKQPERKPWDGPVAVNRVGDYIDISATESGTQSTLRTSEYNAWRLFGMLAVILGIELPKNIVKAIKL